MDPRPRAPAESLDEALRRLAEVLAQPGGNPDSGPVLPAAAELYGGHIEQSRDGTLHIGGQPVRKLYRVADPSEWERAQDRGFFQAHSGYTRASAAPDERWRHHTPTGRRGDTLEIDYHPGDNWHASAEGYAASTARIPLHRV